MVDNDINSHNVGNDVSHKDGFIDLGGHGSHIREQLRVDVPDKVPLSFFEMTDGRPTMDQARVMNYFVQQCRNAIAIPMVSEYTLSRLAGKIQTSEAESFRVKFNEAVVKAKGQFDQAEFSIGEAEELLLGLEKTIQKIKAKDVPLVTPEERQFILSELLTQQASLKAALDKLNIQEQLSEQDKQKRTQLSHSLSETTTVIEYYKIYSKQEIQLEFDTLRKEKQTLMEKIARDPSRKNKYQLEETNLDIDIAQQRLTDYEGYVHEQQTTSIISVEMEMVLRQEKLLLQGISEFTEPEVPGGPSRRELLLAIFALPEAQEALLVS